LPQLGGPRAHAEPYGASTHAVDLHLALQMSPGPSTFGLNDARIQNGQAWTRVAAAERAQRRQSHGHISVHVFTPKDRVDPEDRHQIGV
jgi:hypothetical protein